MINTRSALIDILDAYLESSDGGVAAFSIKISEDMDPEEVFTQLSRVSPTAAIAQSGSNQFAVADGHRNVVAHAALTAGLFRDALCGAAPPLSSPRVSVGVAIGWPAISTAKTLLTDAESACTSAARRPGCYTEIFDDSMRFLELRRSELANALGTALDKDAIDLQYQPTVELASSRWVSLEAYLRWIDRNQGWVPPMDIIPAAERAEREHDLMYRVLDIACRDLVAWQKADCGVPWVSINVSAGQLKISGFYEMLMLKLSEHDLATHRIGLDVPATCLPRLDGPTIELLDKISSAGVCLTLDNVDERALMMDAATQVKFRRFKLDPQLLAGIRTPAGAERLRAILRRSEDRNAVPIVKGVETQRQLDELEGLGAAYAQGFLFARPQPPADINLSPFGLRSTQPIV